MNKIEFRKKILAKEIKKAKAFVGASLVEAINNESDNEYTNILNEVMVELETAICLLERKNTDK